MVFINFIRFQYNPEDNVFYYLPLLPSNCYRSSTKVTAKLAKITGDIAQE